MAQLLRVKDALEAIELANDTQFGLSSATWTNDETERQQFVNDLEAGQVFINGMVALDPHLPFGSVKNSGYGRELSQAGLYEFLNIKTVWISQAQESKKLSDTE